MNVKCGLGYAYVDIIKNGVNKGMYGIFHSNVNHIESPRIELTPTKTKYEAEEKLFIYAHKHNLNFIDLMEG